MTMQLAAKAARVVGLVGAFLFCLQRCEASTIDIVLSQAAQSGAPGSSLTFSGVLTNTSGSIVFLNSAGINLAGGFSPMDSDTTPFLLNAPLSLAGATATPAIDLFTITLPNSIAAGVYPGTFLVLGGLDGSAQDILGTVDFSVGAASTAGTPEPGTALLVGAAMAALLLARRLFAIICLAPNQPPHE